MSCKFNLTAVLLLISIISFGQEFAKEKTEKHSLVEGTNIYMIPPSSFEPTANFKGFQNPTDQSSMVMVLEIPGPYSEVLKGFNSEALKTQGMDLQSKKEIKIGKDSGLLLELTQEAGGMIFAKQALLFGNEQSTTLINGSYLQDAEELGVEIKRSLLSTFVDVKLDVNPREALNYTIDESVGSLKFLSVIGNGILFNRDLKTPTESIDRATLIVEKSFASVEIEDQKLFCISRLKKYPDDYSVIPSKGIEAIEIDGLSGFELFAKNNDNEEEEMYQAALFEPGGGYYLFVGTYLPNSEKAVSDIKRIIQTFARKK